MVFAEIHRILRIVVKRGTSGSNAAWVNGFEGSRPGAAGPTGVVNRAGQKPAPPALAESRIAPGTSRAYSGRKCMPITHLKDHSRPSWSGDPGHPEDLHMPRIAKPDGYTMIELVLVIAILGILAATSIPAWFDRARNNLDVTRRNLVTDLSYAREYAIMKHDHVSAKFNVATNSYSIYLTSTGAGVPDPSNTGRTLSLALDGTNNTGGVAIASANIGGTPGLRFNSWGAPCDSAGNLVTTTGIIRFTSGGYTDTVRVEAETGYVR
jgi:prepilin-type N-terminal cleavage/methylation domain-containing protein